MRIRILDRILVALAGLILVAACAGIVAQVFFGQDVIALVTKTVTPETDIGKVIAGVCAAVLLIVGVYCLLMLFRHRKRKDKFILQKLESGDLAISLKTLETMVMKCLEQHEEIKTEGVHLENQRDGLLIRIRGTVAGGISIPLTADTLQKQVKQYVTACSGVEVKGIRIQIESSGADAKDAPFAIEPPANMLLTKGTESPADEAAREQPMPEPVSETENKESSEAPENEKVPTGEEAAAAAALAAAESMMNGIETEEDDRPIHQRLFSTQEEPCIMPLPPENLASDEEKTKKDANETDGKEEKTDVQSTPETVTEESLPEPDETRGAENNEKD